MNQISDSLGIPQESQNLTLGIRAREQVYGVYREMYASIEMLGEGRHQAMAVTYVVERAHPSYARQLSFGRQVAIIRGAQGLSGPNIEYLINTSEHLRALDIRDRNMERLSTAAGGLFAAAHGEPETLRRRSLALAAVARMPSVQVPRLRLDERRRFQHRNKLS